MRRVLYLMAVLQAAMLPGAARDFWVYKSANLLLPDSVAEVDALLARGRACGVTHLLLTDSKFCRLHEMPERYFGHARRVREAAARQGIAIVPAVCPIGYSNDLLSSDPNLVEGMPAREVPLVVRGGRAEITDAEVPLRGADMSDLGQWAWKDETVTADDGTALVRDPRGRNARLSQPVTLRPWRQHHFSVRVRTKDFRGTPEVKFLAGDQALNHDYLKVASTQDWTVHHVVFNSQEHTKAQLYLGCWDGSTGELRWDDAALEEVAFLNLIRRDGAPLTVRTADGRELAEGRDFEPLTDPLTGTRPYAGCFTVWHEPPVLRTKLSDGTRLIASWHHAVTVHDDQACICPSHPRTAELLRDQIRRVNELFAPDAWMMSHDEIRVWNQCDGCRARGLSAGALLAENARLCRRLIREVDPTARVHVWSDMFDPHHNARDGYYLARGDFAGSWEGLEPETRLVLWHFDKRAESAAFFIGRGHRVVIAGYYDSDPEAITRWLDVVPAAAVDAVMYTTWRNDYRDMERFFRLAGAKGRSP